MKETYALPLTVERGGGASNTGRAPRHQSNHAFRPASGASGQAAAPALASDALSERASAATGVDELAHNGLAVAAARGSEAAYLLRVEAQVVSAADKVREE